MTPEEWNNWISKGINGNDAATIMGLNKKKTPLGLYEEKISKNIDGGNSFITENREYYESKIISCYQFIIQKEYKPILCTMKDFEYLRASIVGRSENKEEITCIFLAGKDEMNNLSTGEIEPRRYAKVQHDLMISGAKVSHVIFYPYNKKRESVYARNMVVVEVFPDKKYQSDLLQSEIKFWDNLLKEKTPTLTKSDYKEFTGPEKHLQVLKKLLRDQVEIESLIELTRDRIIKSAKNNGHPRLICDGIKISINSKGNWRIKI